MEDRRDWSRLYFGHMPKQEVLQAVQNDDWQKVRLSMKGKSLDYKYRTLTNWLKVEPKSRMRQVQVTNYVTALSRGGLIKPEDYR